MFAMLSFEQKHIGEILRRLDVVTSQLELNNSTVFSVVPDLKEIGFLMSYCFSSVCSMLVYRGLL